MPEYVRRRIEERLGSVVVGARSQSGGFSPGVACRLLLENGERVFVKAVCSSPSPDSPPLHRREASIAAALPAEVPTPRLRWSLDDGEWVVLAFDDVDGHTPELPWRADELERVLTAVHALAEALTPSPVDAVPVAETLPNFGSWGRRMAAGAADAPRPPAALRARVEQLAEIESGWAEAVAGDALLHMDLRADNLLLTAERVFVVDWPWASVGAPWVDLAAMLPSVAMQGGPDPDDVWRAHPVSRGVDDDRLDAFVAALAGMFVYLSSLPPAPGLPTLRPFQAAQGEQALRWIARRRGWNDLA